MKRGLVVAIAGAAMVVAGLAGCSSSSHSGGKGTAKVSVDGKDQNITGSIGCVTAAGQVSIAIGDASTGIGAVVSEGDSPTVKSVGLGNINGVTLGYTAGVGPDKAEVTKNGKTYKISGKATGVDIANPLTPLTKPFEIEVTCP